MTASGDQPISSVLREYLGTLISVFRWRLLVSLALMLSINLHLSTHLADNPTSTHSVRHSVATESGAPGTRGKRFS